MPLGPRRVWAIWRVTVVSASRPVGRRHSTPTRFGLGLRHHRNLQRLAAAVGSLAVVLPLGFWQATPVLADPAIITVTTTADSGAGSLRDAIIASNATEYPETIDFAIPGPIPQWIVLDSPLPDITEDVELDGGAVAFDGDPEVVIDGSELSDGDGITFSGGNANNSTIRGLVVVNFPGDGVVVSNAASVTIRDNWIGTDGANDLGNAIAGLVLINAPTADIQGNLISGNGGVPGSGCCADGMGIWISDAASSGAHILGNRIGTNIDGTSAIGNGTYGIVSSAPGTLIGGPDPAQSNLISGNYRGIELAGTDTAGTIVAGNRIGTNAAGTDGLPNQVRGIDLNGTNDTVLIGGPGDGEGNVVSGNALGIVLSGASNAVIQGNLIGVGADGTTPLGNDGVGININFGSTDNTIGGSGPGEGNVISANGEASHGAGILINGGQITNNVIQGNFIGTDRNETEQIPNGYGIRVTAGPAQTIGANTIGGPSPEDGNAIAWNANAGVAIDGDVTGITINANRIHDNGGIGIDLDNDGISANDTDDVDSGANGRQNYPDIVAAAGSQVSGYLVAAPGTYRLELFKNTDCDPSGYGEGGQLIGVLTGQGPGGWSMDTPPVDGENLTMTATDEATGATSEFSLCFDVVGDATDGTHWVGAKSATTAGDVMGAGHGAAGPAQLTYDRLDPDPELGDGENGQWSLYTTAQSAGTIDVPWHYTGFHAYFQVRAKLEWFIVAAAGADTSGVLVDAGPKNSNDVPPTPSGGFDYSGVATFDVAAGDTYGFVVTGSNGDSNETLTGQLILGNAVPESCGDAQSLYDTTRNGRYLIHPDGGQEFSVDCEGMIDTAKDYLSLDIGHVGPGFNFGSYKAGGAANGTDVVTGFTKVRINPANLTVDIGDRLFATSSGTLTHPDGGGSSVVTSMSYATAMGCDGTANGSANIDLRGTPFAVDDTFIPGDADVGASAFTFQNQVVNITGGGFCGWNSPDPDAYNPFNPSPGNYSLKLSYLNQAPQTLATPVVFASVATGANTVDIYGRVDGASNTPLTLAISKATSCVNGALVSPTSLPTANVTTDADGYFKVGSLSGVASGQFVALEVTQPSATDPSSCVRTSADNDYWPKALPLSGASVTTQDVIDVQGKSRWYRFPVVPNQQITVSLTALPADYDLAVFKDIGQEFASQLVPTSTADLTKLSAEFAPQVFSPQVFSPQVFSPQELAQAFSSAQTRSVIGVSAQPATSPESLVVNSWNNTGWFYVRVSGKSGAFDPSGLFSVSISKLPSSCDGVTDTTLTPRTDKAALGVQTVVLTDSSLLPQGSLSTPGSLAERLNAFKQWSSSHDNVVAVVDVAGDARVEQLKAQVQANRSCPFAANLLAEEIKGIVDSYRKNNPDLRYVTILGGDTVIPFFRYPDQSHLGQESGYFPPVKSDSISEASLREDYVLSQDAYGSGVSVSVRTNAFPVPGLAVGRLVETPSEIAGQLDAFVTAGGVVHPTSSLVTGYDFLEDAAKAVRDELRDGTGQAPDDQLITPNGVSPQDPTAWTANQLRTHLFNSGRHDLVFLAGHFSANSALAADFSTSIITTELQASTTDFANSIVFSAGCHSGYNLLDGEALNGASLPLDWAQAFAQKRAILVAGTGYQYGDTDFLEYSERLYRDFAHALRAGDVGTPVSIGVALRNAKLSYLATTPDIKGIHEKALLEATLFGLPMWGVDMPGQRTGTAGAGGGVTPVPVPSGPAADLGLATATTTLTTGLGSPSSRALLNPPYDNPNNFTSATWYEGPSQAITTNPGEPTLPLLTTNVTSTTSEYVLRGVGMRGGSYLDTANVTPLTGAATTEIRGVHTAFASSTFYPMKVWTANYFGALGGQGGTNLLTTPVQYVSDPAHPGKSIERKYTGLNFKLFYSNNLTSAALSDAPTIVSTDTQPDGSGLLFSAQIVGDPKVAVHEAWVTYTTGTGSWVSLDLAQCVTPLPLACGTTEDSRIWRARLATNPANLKYIVQAANGLGLVSFDSNRGQLYSSAAIAAPAATALTFVNPPSSGTFGQTATVTVDLKSGGNALAGRTVVVTIGGGPAFGVTDSNGRVSIPILLSAQPGPSQIAASFGGDPAFLPSSASNVAFTIGKASSQLLLVPGSTTVNYATPVTLTATLTGGGTPLAQRTIAFLVTGPAGTTLVPGTTDYTGSAKLTLPSNTVGSFSIDARFGSVVNAPGGGRLDLTDSTYGPVTASASATLTASTSTVVTLTRPLPYAYDGSAFGATAVVTGPGQPGPSPNPAVNYLGTLSTGVAYGPTSTAPVGAGSYTASATFPGGGGYGPSSGSVSYSVAKAAQTITFAGLPDRLLGDPDFAISASASSGLAVAFTVSGQCTLVTGPKIHLTAVGACAVTAKQAGNANYNAAPDVARSFAIRKPQTITFTSTAPSAAVYGDTYTPTATATSGLAVTFGASGACSFSGGKVKMDQLPGTCTVTANQAGNSTWAPAPQKTQVFTVGKKTATLGYSGSLFVSAGGATSVDVLLTGLVTPSPGGAPVLTGAPVEFRLFHSGNFTGNPDVTCSVAAIASGVATCTKTLGLDDWTVVLRMPDNPYFTAPDSDAVVLTVYQTTPAKHTSGAGWVIDPSYHDIPVKVAAAPRNKGYFGFAVSYKSGTTPQGVAVYTFRGVDNYDYVFTTTSWTGGGLSFGSGSTASFSSKCSVTVINPATRKVVPGLGGTNFTCRWDVTDGSPDTLAMSTWNASGVLYHQVGTTPPAGQIPLGSGSIVVKK